MSQFTREQCLDRLRDQVAAGRSGYQFGRFKGRIHCSCSLQHLNRPPRVARLSH